MRRLRGVRRALAAVLAALLAWAGAIGLARPALAASGPAPDLRPKAIFFQRTGNTSQRALVLSSMEAESAWKSGLWADFLDSWDAANNGVKVYTSTPVGLPAKGHVFVVLGSALSSSGKMTAVLERRLRVALAALSKYPKSKVLVTGGAPRNGRTEAQVMRSWLVAKGIAPARIIVEAASASTVSNATNSMAILNRSTEYTSYTLISDASHIRRATILFNAAAVGVQEKTGKPWTITGVANVAYSDSSTASRGPVPEATATIIASNVASVFGVLAPYRALLSSPPAAATLTSIALTAPTTLTYRVGQGLDTAGLKVTALYNQGLYSKVVTSDATITGFSSANVGTVAVTVGYTEGGVTKTASFPCEIVKASSQVKAGLSTSKITASRTRVVVTATVTTSASEVVPVGKVEFYLDGTKLKTITMALVHGGVVTFKYPTISASGNHQIVVKYLGSSQLGAAKRTVTVKVTT